MKLQTQIKSTIVSDAVHASGLNKSKGFFLSNFYTNQLWYQSINEYFIFMCLDPPNVKTSIRL